MPDVDIISRPLSILDKRKMIEAITKTFGEETGSDPFVVTVRFHGVDDESYAVGGRLLADTFNVKGRPAPAPIFQINVAWYDNKTPEQQEKVVRRLTEAAKELPGLERHIIGVTFQLLTPQNAFENGTRVAFRPGPA